MRLLSGHLVWCRVTEHPEEAPFHGASFLCAENFLRHNVLCCRVASHPSCSVLDTTPGTLPIQPRESPCCSSPTSHPQPGCPVTEHICGNQNSGSSLDVLPALHANRRAGVGHDLAISRHGHGAIARRLWVVRTTLQSEPLRAAGWALQWFIGSGRSPSPSI